MNVLQWFTSQEWVDHLGRVLLHFLWEGAAIALAYALAREVMRRAGPNRRYLLGCAAMAAMAMAPVATWFLTASAASLDSSGAVWSAGGRASSEGGGSVLIFLSNGSPLRSSAMSWVVSAWLIGASAFWLRLLGGWAAAARMRQSRPAPEEWQQRLAALSRRMGVARRVRLMVSPLAHAPAVAGWLKPVVLTPVGALSGLPAAQVEAVLAHELAHVLRNDYLVNLFQSVVEALLFYHPAVWWISGHIRQEREMCCDDIAAAVGGDALAYASALAEIAVASRTQASLAMAATGGRLRPRIARLLGHPDEPGRPGRGAVAGLLLLALVAYGVCAQQSAQPAFQVASVKRNAEVSPRAMSVRPQPGGRLTARNAPLRLLLQNAYSVQSFQIAGGPEWVNSDGYDIEAKPEGSASETETRLMLRTLLADRFHLTLRHETRELPEYALTVSKGGLKQPEKAQECTDAEAGAPPRPGTFPCGRLGVMGEPGGARLRGSHVPISDVTRMLGMLMGSIVVDRTGHAAPLDIDVPFAPDQSTAGLMGPMGPVGKLALPANEGDTPNIFAALQERLGLKLEPIKGPVDVLVIDHVERPTEN